jgi:AcrR family transcriptional regulator
MTLVEKQPGGNHMYNDTSRSLLHSRSPSDRRDDENRDDKKSSGTETHQLIIEVAERLFRQIGFQKTTVADIARQLHMSSANVYRFFAAKSDIHDAVCMDLLGRIEAEAKKIATSHGTAAQKIRNLFGAVHTIHYEQYNSDRNLYALLEASIAKWAAMRHHRECMTEISEQIIASGMASGEFPAGDAALASRLINTGCLQFRDPRLIVEHEQDDLDPTLDEMCDFCIAAINYKRKVVSFPSGEEIDG